ncbi:MAG: 16S rRNA (guanine(527)-N(7))-methyltransferase RsmG [Chlorobi bacterium]|nr:16S rRNA (guanine(527)-N(7))-methyltransferase RsmG [Chlorobiota bacterium]
MDLQEQYLRELKQLFWANSLTPDVYQLERLAHFAALVAEKNEKVNLISRKDISKIIENHIFLSALIANYIPNKALRFLDVGTGGGFPGIPIAIMNPFLKGVLVDSTAKKIAAVQEFIDKLKLSNLSAVNERVEGETFISKYENSFDLIVSRATVPLIILFRYAVPLIKNKAYLISVKGGKLEEELKKAEMKYKAYIKKSTVFELAYKPSNIKNKKGKKLILLELSK